MRGLTFFVLHQQQNLGRGFSASKLLLGPHVALAAVHSMVVVLLSLIRY